MIAFLCARVNIEKVFGFDLLVRKLLLHRVKNHRILTQLHKQHTVREYLCLSLLINFKNCQTGHSYREFLSTSVSKSFAKF